ncbi:MAG: DVUA0089 family protein [Opitutaceae bacterium]|nr:DVUA0089 family protein [Opitutaceae bacterium]
MNTSASRNTIRAKFALLATVFLCALTPSLHAAPVTAEQAKTAVRNWRARTAGPLGETAIGQNVRDVISVAADTGGTTLCHIVSMEGGGFVITSADTTIRPVVVFSSDSIASFIADERNPLYALLKQDIESRRAAAATPSAAPATMTAAGSTATAPAAGSPEAEWADLLAATAPASLSGGIIQAAAGVSSIEDVRRAPLVQTQWGQSGGIYNNYYYSYAGHSSQGYPAGCVATAGAQVMRFFQWPQDYVAEFSEECSIDGIKFNARAGGRYYNWANMPYIPGNSPSLAVKQAIGQLVIDVGVAVEMVWGENSSSSNIVKLANAFTEKFNYGHAKSIVSPSRTQWNNAVLASLDYGSPCVLGILGSAGGHAVIADGYGFRNGSGSLWVHLNMGWDGYDNLWYNMEAGIAASGHTFENPFGQVAYSILEEVGSQTNHELWSMRVVNASGNPVSGASVTITNSDSGTTFGPFTTNNKGILGLHASFNTNSYTFDISANYNGQIGSASLTLRPSNSSSVGNRWGVEIKLGSAGAGTSADDYEADNSAATAKTISNGEAQNRSLHQAGDVDWMKFTLERPSDVTIRTAARAGYIGGDTVIYLYGPNSSSTLVASNDDDESRSGYWSRIDCASLAAGTYYIKVTGYENTVIPGYQILLDISNSVTGDSYEADNTAATAKTISSGQAQNHSIHQGGDTDWIKFTLTQTSDIVLQTQELPGYNGGDTVITLYGPNSTTAILDGNDDYTDAHLWSKITRSALATGTYYVEVKAYGNTAIIDGYQFLFSATPTGSDNVAVTGVSLNTSEVTLTVGGKEALIATVDPCNATITTVTWSSSDDSVAMVSADGLVTAVGTGIATITVTTDSGGKTASAAITVIAPETYTITLDKNGGTGGTASVTATAGLPMPVATAPTRAGHMFLGYYDTSAGTGGTQYYTASMSSARDWDKTTAATLYARWAAVVTVTFNINAPDGILGITSKSIAPGSTYGALPEPARDGYVFGGWWTVGAGNGNVSGAQITSASTVATGAMSHMLYAKWTVVPPTGTPVLELSKTILALGQAGGATAAFNVTSNIAWTAQTQPAGATWLSPLTTAGDGAAAITVRTNSANTTGAPRTAGIVVSGGNITRTVIVTQRATAAAGRAPATLAVGNALMFTFTNPVEIHTYTVAAGNQLTATDAQGAINSPYEYEAFGDNATLVFLDAVWSLNFTSAVGGTFVLHAFDDDGPYELTGIFTLLPTGSSSYGLSIISTGGGSINTTAGPHTVGATVTATAIPNSGHTFAGWTAVGVTLSNPLAATITFTMPANNVTLTANFTATGTGGNNNNNTNNNSGGGGGGGGGAPMPPVLALLAALFAMRASRRK